MKRILSKKIGRPTDNPKTKLLQIRLDNDTLNKLDECANIKKTSKSEIVRTGINEQYDKIKK